MNINVNVCVPSNENVTISVMALAVYKDSQQVARRSQQWIMFFGRFYWLLKLGIESAVQFSASSAFYMQVFAYNSEKRNHLVLLFIGLVHTKKNIHLQQCK